MHGRWHDILGSLGSCRMWMSLRIWSLWISQIMCRIMCCIMSLPVGLVYCFKVLTYSLTSHFFHSHRLICQTEKPTAVWPWLGNLKFLTAFTTRQQSKDWGVHCCPSHSNHLPTMLRDVKKDISRNKLRTAKGCCKRHQDMDASIS